MPRLAKIRCLFLDIGGVLLSNGWDHLARAAAADRFKLDPHEFEERHRLAFPPYEEGRLSLEEYLGLTVFYRRRNFSASSFRAFIFAQSKALPGALDFFKRIKQRHGLKVLVLSNEGHEINAYRLEKFKLPSWVDFFVSSCFVGLRKPDPAMLGLALDQAQVPARQVLYIENTRLFVEVARSQGLRSILHTDLASTRKELAALGLGDTPGRRR